MTTHGAIAIRGIRLQDSGMVRITLNLFSLEIPRSYGSYCHGTNRSFCEVAYNH